MRGGGAVWVQVFHERNAAVHAADYEGRPERRPLTRAELQVFFDTADDHVERAAGSRRKGWLAAFRDATLFKVVYGWGLRRREAAMLDVADFAPWSPGNFVDISIMLLLVPNCQIGARNPLGLSCRADVVSGRDCNIARCSRTRRS